MDKEHPSNIGQKIQTNKCPGDCNKQLRNRAHAPNMYSIVWSWLVEAVGSLDQHFQPLLLLIKVVVGLDAFPKIDCFARTE